MYTVLRFMGSSHRFEELGQRINAIIPGLYDGPDRRGKCFSCGICSADSWAEHQARIVDVLQQLGSVIESANASGFELQIDTAVEPEDYRARWITEIEFDRKFAEFLQAKRVAICVTVYGQGPETEDKPDQ